MEKHVRQSEGAEEFIGWLYCEYCDEAAASWYLRNKAASAPHCDLNDLLETDNRLEAQIDALRVAGQTGWETCKESFGMDAGYCFAASVLAFESADEERISMILEKAADTELSQGIICALGWLSYEQAEPHIQKLLKSDSPEQQCIGLAASAIHRREPQRLLDHAIYSPYLPLKTSALFAVGELGKGGLIMLRRLQENWSAKEPEVRFAAAWSSVLLNDVKALDTLKTFVNPQMPFCEKALGIAMRRMDLRAALAWQRELAKSPDTLRLAVQAVGIIGDPALVPWLLEQMNIPAQARVAGEAFAMITGIDIAKAGLEGKWPEGFEAGPNDDPNDPNVEPDPDEDLPWPERTLVSEWWNKNRNKFQTGTRLLLGKPITKENIAAVLSTGYQRQRAAAALEQAILTPGKPLYNISAPAWRQMPPPTPAARAISGPPNYGPRELAITAVNCITPVGLDAEMTAASVRAGITRLEFHDEYKDAGGNEIIISKIKGIKDDEADTIERLSTFAEICLKDLLGQYFLDNPPKKPPYEAHLFLGIPFKKRPGPDYGDKCINTQTPIMALWFANPAVETISQGNASLHHAIKNAAHFIASKPNAFCIIGVIDSLLQESTLNWLQGSNRLKSASYGCHHGLPASEAVCFLIVEDLERARQAKRPILARISSLGLSEEPHPRASDLSSRYTGLSEACQTAMWPLKNSEIKAVFGDLNGEDERAEEWGTATLRCFQKGEKKPPTYRLHDSYGDIGAASGAVMAAIVTQGFARDWLQSPVMIFCSDDHGSCGAVVLEKDSE